MFPFVWSLFGSCCLLAWCPFPVGLLLLPNLAIDWQCCLNTFMGSRSPTQDDEVIELSLSLRGLDITVRGPARRASEALSLITGSLAGLSASAPASDGSFEVVSAAPESVSVGTTSRLESRAEIASSFLPCPAVWYGQGSRLVGSDEAVRGRIRRAWVAGQWARAVLDRRVLSPNRSEPLDLRSRFYAVVRCRGLDCPVVFRSSGGYWRAVGSFSGSGEDSISHSFPSECEARAYLVSAGFSEPFEFRD